MKIAAEYLNLEANPIESKEFRASSKQTLDENGVLRLRNFLTDEAVDSIRIEGELQAQKAYYTTAEHNVYLLPHDFSYDVSHARNRKVSSSKGCITTDQISESSILCSLYHNAEFKAFLCAVLSESSLHEYADTLSSINLHYASAGQELGWHFDNSSFAITLLIQKPMQGGIFEFVENVRNADAGEMNFDAVDQILDGKTPVKELPIEVGDLVLFRGRNAMHRVTPTIGDTTRMLVVLAYNTEPGIALSESARQTFYGRL